MDINCTMNTTPLFLKLFAHTFYYNVSNFVSFLRRRARFIFSTSIKPPPMKHVSLFLAALACLSSISLFSQHAVWHQEAENAVILGTSEILTDRQYASGPDKAIVKIGSESGNRIAFEDIDISNAGSYQLRIYYFHTQEQPLEIVVNDHPIIFSRYGEGNHPVINGSTAPGGDHLCAILINNQDGIKLQSLEVTNDRCVPREGVNDTDAYGILVLNDDDEIMQGFHFDNLIIREVYALHLDGVPFNSIIVSGMRLESTRNMEAGKEKHIRDVLIENCYVTRTARLGMSTRHPGGLPGVGDDSINRHMNMVFRNNHFFELGGTGILPSGTYNTLLEYNTFEYRGSNVDPRMLPEAVVHGFSTPETSSHSSIDPCISVVRAIHTECISTTPTKMCSCNLTTVKTAKVVSWKFLATM